VAGGCPDNTRCACAQCRTTDDCPEDHFCDETGSCLECLSAGRGTAAATCGACLPNGAPCTIFADGSDACCDDPEEMSCLPAGVGGAFICVD
jgi:hypothetical protein